MVIQLVRLSGSFPLHPISSRSVQQSARKNYAILTFTHRLRSLLSPALPLPLYPPRTTRIPHPLGSPARSSDAPLISSLPFLMPLASRGGARQAAPSRSPSVAWYPLESACPRLTRLRHHMDGRDWPAYGALFDICPAYLDVRS
jgi:hypothetical protein